MGQPHRAARRQLGTVGGDALAEVDPYRRHALPPLDVDPPAARDFEEAFGRLLHGGSYGLERSKADFLRYLVSHHPVLLHGSNDPAIGVFEPREKPDFLERPVRAVFATSDGVWPIFFAITDRSVVVEMRNNCERAGTVTHYYFSVATRPRAVSLGAPVTCTSSRARGSITGTGRNG